MKYKLNKKRFSYLLVAMLIVVFLGYQGYAYIQPIWFPKKENLDVNKWSTYTEFFFNSNLERSLYLRGIEPISKGLIKLSELKKISCFEFSVNDYLRRGGISERNLNQRGDGKRGWSTGTLKNTINPFNSGDVSEHLDSKLEDAFPEI